LGSAAGSSTPAGFSDRIHCALNLVGGRAGLDHLELVTEQLLRRRSDLGEQRADRRRALQVGERLAAGLGLQRLIDGERRRLARVLRDGGLGGSEVGPRAAAGAAARRAAAASAAPGERDSGHREPGRRRLHHFLKHHDLLLGRDAAPG
jgi:hypothetical protein